MLSMLGQRDLLFTADLPAELDRERRLVRAEYENALSRLHALPSGEDQERALESLRDLRVRLDEIAARVRSEAPRLAGLTAPETLSLCSHTASAPSRATSSPCVVTTCVCCPSTSPKPV
jgi:hypothetical protein